MRFVQPNSIQEVTHLLSNEKGKAFVLGGGTDLLVKMKSGSLEPDLVVDIKKIKELSEIKTTPSGFSIGAAVPSAALGENSALTEAWPGVVEGASLIGSKQIQSRCTMAGNLCNASPAADSVPGLIAAQAVVNISGPGGMRKSAVADIAVGVGRNSLQKGEFITSIELPKKAPRSSDAYLRFIPRTEMDIAVVSCAVNLTLGDDGKIIAARVVLGAVAVTAVLVPDAAKAIIGSKLDENALANLAIACSSACKPIEDKRGTVEFRTEVAGVLAKRAAKIAYTRAGGKT